MKYLAKLNEQNIVEKVQVVHNNIAPTEQAGIDFLSNLHGYSSWIQCSKDRSIRKNGAGIGYTYDEDRDAFIPPKNYPSWILNEDTCNWEAPIAYPDDGQRYNWNEETTSWDLRE